MIDIKDMFACGVHYGHRTAFSDPRMAQYVYTQKNDLQIIDLTQTSRLFAEGLTFVDQLVRSGGRIVVIGTKQAAQQLVQKYGIEMEMPYVDQRWYAGTLTNFKTIRSSVDRLAELDKRFKVSDFKGLTKKERLVLQRERAKLTLSLGGVKELNTLPEALFVIDVSQERIAIKEANKLGIPVVGIVDTNCSPEGVDYVIPGNDDAMSAIEYYLDCLSQVVKVASSELKAVQEKIAKRNKPVIKKAPTKEVSVKSEKEVSVKVEVAEEKVEKKPVKKVVKKVAKATMAVEPEKKTAKEVVSKSEKEETKATVKKVVSKKPAAKKAVVKKVEKSEKKSASKPSTKE